MKFKGFPDDKPTSWKTENRNSGLYEESGFRIMMMGGLL